MSDGQTSDCTNRSPPLWNTDGNLFIIASDNTQFRVHRIFLTHHSPVFRDALALPQPNDSETLDGFPVIRLQDPPDGLEYLIKTLYNGLWFLPLAPSKKYGEIVVSLLHSTTKYDMEDLRAVVVTLFLKIIPKDLDEVEATQDLKRGPDGFYLHPAHIVRIARESDLPEVLPAAFYLLQSISAPSWSKEDRAEIEKLSREDLMRLLIGKERLLRRMSSLLLRPDQVTYWARVRGSVINRHRDMQPCLSRLDDRLTILLDSKIRDVDVIKLLRDAVNDLRRKNYPTGHPPLSACKECLDDVCEALNKKKLDIWTAIQEDFEL